MTSGRKTKPAASARAANAARKSGGPTPGKAPTAAAAAERRAKVFELRRAGVPFRAVGQALGIDIATAYRDYQQALEELLPVEDVEDQRRIELDRIDGVRQALWPQVLKGDYRAVDRYMVASERYARLAGIDYDMKLEQQRISLDTARVQMMRELVLAGIAALGLTAEQERVALTAMAERQRAIEATAKETIRGKPLRA